MYETRRKWWVIYHINWCRKVVVSKNCNLHPYLGKIPNLTNIFQRGWNHQLPPTRYFVFFNSQPWDVIFNGPQGAAAKDLDRAVATDPSDKKVKLFVGGGEVILEDGLPGLVRLDVSGS